MHLSLHQSVHQWRNRFVLQFNLNPSRFKRPPYRFKRSHNRWLHQPPLEGAVSERVYGVFTTFCKLEFIVVVAISVLNTIGAIAHSVALGFRCGYRHRRATQHPQ